MENTNNSKIERKSIKSREVFSFPLNIPAQTDQFNRAFEKYRNEFELPHDSTKKDFFLFLLRHYLKEENNSELQQSPTKVVLDTSGEKIQAFERAFERRASANLSKTREELICLLLEFARPRVKKNQLLND